MIEKVSSISQSEKEILYNALPLITILVAGADGKIDQEESAWGKKLTNIRGYDVGGKFNDFYTNAAETYEEKFDEYMRSLPSNVKERSEVIGEKLSKVNPILARIEPSIGGPFYKSLVSFAEHIAKSSGGILGFGSVSKEEKKVMSLSMLTPIEYVEEEVAEEDEETTEE